MAGSQQTDLDDVYRQAVEGGAEALYETWAQRYDADNAALGFRLPAMASAFAARHIPAGARPILDAGCGTGLVGSCLSALGYPEIVGLDLSEAMLEAAAKTQAYKRLEQQTLGEPLAFVDATFDGVLCIGSFGPGHAPPESLFELCRVARPNAPIIFNVIERTWEDQGFPAVVARLEADRAWRLEERSSAWRPYTIGEPELKTLMFVFRSN